MWAREGGEGTGRESLSHLQAHREPPWMADRHSQLTRSGSLRSSALPAWPVPFLYFGLLPAPR